MKKIIFNLLALFLIIVPISVSANTNISFKNDLIFINNISIPCIPADNGNLYIWVDDLNNYGFDVKNEIIRDNPYYKKFSVTKNRYKQYKPIDYQREDKLTLSPSANKVYFDEILLDDINISEASHTLIPYTVLERYGTIKKDNFKNRIDITIDDTRLPLPESMKFYEILGITSKEQIKYGTIEFVTDLNNKIADLNKDDINLLLNSTWNFNYSLETMKHTSAESGKVFINLWTSEKEFERSNNHIKFTIYPDKILYGGYGKRTDEKTGVEYTNTGVWYVAKGNGANSIYNVFNTLSEKYKNSTRNGNGYDSESYFKINSQYLPVETASNWALSEINEAANWDLLPYKFTNDYQKIISRQDFCEITYNMLTKISNVTDLLYQDTVLDIDDISFTDAENLPYETKVLTALGIIKGNQNREFLPNDYITREETVTILNRINKLLNINFSDYNELTFCDKDQISNWAKSSVEALYNMKIINGHDDGSFAPKANINSEQSIITVYRFYKYAIKNTALN